MIRAIIFDCFGVIVTDALQPMVANLQQVDPGKAIQLIDAVTARNKGLIDRDAYRAEAAALLDMSPDEYMQRIKSGEAINRAVLDMAEQLRHKYKTAMLSNVGSLRSIHTRLSPDELSASFDAVILSGEIGFAKPEARAYEVTAERLGVRLDECVMIDDLIGYCEGAKSVGMAAILYSSVPQLKAELSEILA